MLISSETASKTCWFIVLCEACAACHTAVHVHTCSFCSSFFYFTVEQLFFHPARGHCPFICLYVRSSISLIDPPIAGYGWGWGNNVTRHLNATQTCTTGEGSRGFGDFIVCLCDIVYGTVRGEIAEQLGRFPQKETAAVAIRTRGQRKHADV